MGVSERPPIHDPSSTKVDTDLNVAELLREVADELEEQNDPQALSHMGKARVKRLVRDLNGARSLRFYEPRVERTETFLDSSYLTSNDGNGGA